MIRKLSIGSDYKNAMHYIVGQVVLKDSTIHIILFEKNMYNIYIENNAKEVMLWKSFNQAMPIAVEYNLNF